MNPQKAQLIINVGFAAIVTWTWVNFIRILRS